MRSLAVQDADLQVSFCDASGDPRVAEEADSSGIAFAHRRHGPDKGQSDAIAEGWANTDAEILGWLNADDVLTPWALAEANAAFEVEPDIDVFFGESTILDIDGATTGVHPAVAPPSDMLLRACIISQPSCFFRRSAVDAVGGLDIKNQYTMDWDLWSRLYRNKARFAYSPSYFSAVVFELGTKTSSLPPKRMKELYSIASAGAGAYAGVKNVFGNMLHKLSQYTPMRHPVRALRRKELLPEFDDGGNRGVTAAGRFKGEAVFPVLNLTDEAQGRLKVELVGNGAGAAAVSVDGVEASGPERIVELSTPVAPGEAASLRLKADANAPGAFFERAYWV